MIYYFFRSIAKNMAGWPLFHHKLHRARETSFYFHSAFTSRRYIKCHPVLIFNFVIVLVLLLGDNLLHDDKGNAIKQFAYSSTHQQDMLELAEQITVACGGDSSMSNCQHLCREHMLCGTRGGIFV